MKTTDRQLRKELRQAGAETPEIDGLVSMAGSLRLLKEPAAGRTWLGVLKPALVASSALVVGVMIVMLAQSAAPTSWLYPVQKLSDSVAIKAHPQYRATVMMRRAQQVNQLIASHASTRTILSTLDSYDSEASHYKSLPGASYATFDYCKANLEQAKTAAPASVRQAITNSLDSLDTT
jgi:hypothetical protein